MINKEDLNFAKDIIFKYKDTFDQYKKETRKLQAVKDLKELTGLGLKDAKDVIDMYWDGQIVFIKEFRKEKLERLAKKPLAEILTQKIEKMDSSELINIFMKMNIDTLLLLDDFFPEQK